MLTFLSYLIFFNCSWFGRLLHVFIRFCRSRGPCRDSRGPVLRFESKFCNDSAKAYPDDTGRVND